MATIKSVIEKARTEQHEERLCKFHDFLIDQFGGPLLIGDILELPASAVFDRPLGVTSGSMTLIVQNNMGHIRGSATVALPLMHLEYNTTASRDIHVFGYPINRLKRAKFIGHQQLVIGDGQIGFCDVIAE